MNVFPQQILLFSSMLACALCARATSTPDPLITFAPLAPKSGPRGATLFALVPPSASGIVVENNYADPEMWGKRYQELVYGEIGSGVSIADFDNDGRPDLLIASKTEGIRLFKNLGGWKFEDVTAKAGLVLDSGVIQKGMSWLSGLMNSANRPNEGVAAWTQGVTFVDIDNDGWLDLYVCRFDAPNLLYINQHNGSFVEEAAARGLALIDACGVAAFADYDRDGALDVFIQTNLLDAASHPNGQRDHLLHNDGKGNFTEVTDQAGISGETEGHSATWWDYDDDGWPDLYVANDYRVQDQLYHNNHDGTFRDTAASVLPHVPYYAMGSDLGDINNDGLVDFFVSDMAPSTHETDQRGMAGSRSRLGPEQNRKPLPQFMRNALFLNTGRGPFMEVAQLAGLGETDWTWSVRLEDLDNDGRLDVHVTNGMTREYHNEDLLEKSMRAETPAEGRAAIKQSPVLAERNFAFRNLGDLHFEDVSAPWGLAEQGVSFGAAFGDLDGDGDLDLVYVNYQKGVTVLRNDSDSGHRLIVALRGTRSNRFGIGAKIRVTTESGMQVRELTLARGYLSSSEPVAHFGLGDAAKIARLEVEWPSGTRQVFKDLAADQRLTLTEPAPVNDASKNVGSRDLPIAPPLYRLSGNAEVGRAATGNTGTESAGVTSAVRDAVGAPPALAPAMIEIDVDGDGVKDRVTAKPWETVRYFHGAKDGRPEEEWTERAGFAKAGAGLWTSIAPADLNGDGRVDFVVGNVGLNTPYRASEAEPMVRFTGEFVSGQPAFSIESYFENGKLYPRLTRKELAKLMPSVLRRFPRNDVYARSTLEEIVTADALGRARRETVTELRSGVFLSRADGAYRFVALPRLAQVAQITGCVTADFDGDGQIDIYVIQNTAGTPTLGKFDGGVSLLLRGDGRGNFSAVSPRESGLVIKGEMKAVEIAGRDGAGHPIIRVTRADGSTVTFEHVATKSR